MNNIKFKISNLKFQINGGYTLIELTIVMVIMLVVGGLVVGIIASAFRGSTKTKITNDVAQSGNYAMSVITNIITNSQKFESFNSLSPVSGSINRCDTDPASGTSGPFSGDSLTVMGFDGGVTQLSCNPDGTMSSNSASLLDNSRVKATSCLFTCTQLSPFSPPRIDISFNLINISGQTLESQGAGTFNTSVTFRNTDL